MHHLPVRAVFVKVKQKNYKNQFNWFDFHWLRSQPWLDFWPPFISHKTKFGAPIWSQELPTFNKNLPF
jgi:hypothetical protein